MKIFVEFDLTNGVHQEIYNYVRARMHSEKADVVVSAPAPTAVIENPSTQLGSGIEEESTVTPDECRELIAKFDAVDPKRCFQICTDLFSGFGVRAVSELSGNQAWTLKQTLERELNATGNRF